MVKHIVFWQIKEDLDTEGVFEEMKIRVEAMNGQVPGLIKVELGQDFNGSEVAYDVALYSELINKEALAVYQGHPLHLHVKEFIGAVTSARCVVDYEV
jgi:stress responsive alpha/beta barrel protein